MSNYSKDINLLFSKLEDYDINNFYLENKFPRNAWDFTMKEIISSIDVENLDGVEICKLFEGLGYASKDGGLNFAIGAHSLASLIPFSIYASSTQKELYLDKLLNGTLICSNAITETEAGSDIFSMQSTASKNKGSWVLNGTKTFCSNIVDADIALVYVKTNSDKGVHGGISTFIVEKNQFKIGQTYSKMGLRTCSIGELILDQAEVKENQMLGKEGAGLAIFSSAMEWERVGLSAVYVGTMKRLFEQALEYAKTRNQGGQNIGKYQAISHKIAEIKTTIKACELMVFNAAKKLGKDRAVMEDASMCKWYVSEVYIKVCQHVMQIFGGNGYMEEYEIERCLRDAHASTIYSGTTEVQKNIIAKWNGL